MTNPFTQRLTRNLPGPRESRVLGWIWIGSGTLTVLAIWHLVLNPALDAPVGGLVILLSLPLLMLGLILIPMTAAVLTALFVHRDSQEAAFAQILLTDLAAADIVSGYIDANLMRLHNLRAGMWGMLLPMWIMFSHFTLAIVGVEVRTVLFALFSTGFGLFVMGVILGQFFRIAVMDGVEMGVRATSENGLASRLFLSAARVFLMPIIAILLLTVSLPELIMLIPVAWFIWFAIVAAGFRPRAIRAVEARRAG